MAIKPFSTFSGYEIKTASGSVQILTGSVDLEATGVVAGLGSLYLKSDGTVWKKDGAASTDWADLSNPDLSSLISDIATNTANITSNDTDIATNVTDIATNVTDIATNVTDIATNATDIATNATDIATNVTDIATNAANIASNDTDIAANTAAIVSNDTDIATNAAAIASNDTDIATNASGISTNAAAIASNDTDIATNAAAIASNDTDIATNVSDIATNATDIAANDAAAVHLAGTETITGAKTFSADVNLVSGASLTVDGDLVVNGTQTTVSTTDLAITDNKIEINSGETGAGISHASGVSGFEINRGTEDNTSIVYNETGNSWQISYDGGTTFSPIVTEATLNVSIGTTAVITALQSDVATNQTDIATNATDIATNAGNIASNDTDIATNASNIATNAANITSNDTDIAANTAAIVSNDSDIAANAAAIASNDTDIATNVTNIAANTAAIASNDTDIATNVSDIATNAAAIASNDTDIAANATDIGTLEAYVGSDTALATDGTYTAGSTVREDIDLLDAALEEATEETKSITAIAVPTVLDTVPTVDAKVVKWELYASLDSNPDDSISMEIKAFRNSTNIDFTLSNVIDLGTSVDIDVKLNGANIELEVDATAATSFFAKREVIL